MKLYIACALTKVPRRIFTEYSQFLHDLAASLSRMHDVRYALVNSDPQLASRPVGDRARLCYRWDESMVLNSDLVVAECSFPSIGLGIEMQMAAGRDIPILICFRDFGNNRAKPVTYVNPD